MNVTESELRGLLLIELDLHEDVRGNFREVFHAGKMSGFPGMGAFRPVQQNVSYNVLGTIRGMHAEPWDKFIHVAYGEVLAAIVDLRPPEPTFGRHETFRLAQHHALFVPQGFANGFQVLSAEAVYVYVVSSHWDPSMTYPAVAYDDPDLAIGWVEGIEQVVSDKDRKNPSFAEVRRQL
jgi:dTDP-4-dehydrorhamnose 3,5-epimerase